MTKTAIILMAILMSTARVASASAETDYIDEQLARIQTEYSVRVHYRYETNLFFPSEWLNPQLGLHAGEIEVAEVTRLLPILQQFFDAHPATVISNHLEHVFLLKELGFQGKPYGSTHHTKNIYLVCDGMAKRYDEEFLACRLHSEFCSILMTHHPFPSDRWSRINPEGFTYSGTGFEVLDRPSNYDSTQRSCSEGFLVNYCRSSLENDFGIFSSWLFVKNNELNVLAQQHVKLDQKKNLAEQFYLSISPEYTFN